MRKLAIIIVVVVVVVAACGGRSPAPPPTNKTAATPACLADEIGPLRYAPQLDNSCLQEPGSCERRCAANDPMACMYYGLELQRTEAGGNGAGSREVFARACKRGLAIGCTNYAAGQLNDPSAHGDPVCIRRLFEASCRVKEPFGCGMIGRMLAATARTTGLERDRVLANQHFDAACADVGGVTCYFHAVHLAQGDLGPADPAKIKALLERACATGHPEACGLAP